MEGCTPDGGTQPRRRDTPRWRHPQTEARAGSVGGALGHGERGLRLWRGALFAAVRSIPYFRREPPPSLPLFAFINYLWLLL